MSRSVVEAQCETLLDFEQLMRWLSNYFAYQDTSLPTENSCKVRLSSAAATSSASASTRWFLRPFRLAGDYRVGINVLGAEDEASAQLGEALFLSSD
jgi:hypothetical protein